jgi:hypothetical protein
MSAKLRRHCCLRSIITSFTKIDKSSLSRSKVAPIKNFGIYIPFVFHWMIASDAVGRPGHAAPVIARKMRMWF